MTLASTVFRLLGKPLDLLLSIIAIPAACTLLLFRWIGAAKLPRTSRALRNVGVFPIRDHYYEPMFNGKHLLRPLDEDRDLPGLDLRSEEQLALLSRLDRADELRELNLTRAPGSALDFSIDNGSFESGDAEFLYQMIRFLKPGKIIEVGSGNSTKIARLALHRNDEQTGRRTTHVCIEPYEQPWLQDLPGITLIRERIERLEFDWATELDEGDLLFIDSSHIIRPQGDVLTEYLRIFPRLAKGVHVHVHDIFTPKDYPKQWVLDEVRLWNEQYLLEALLTDTARYEVVAALNYLKHHHYAALSRVCPYLAPDREPGSFYFRVRS